MGKRAKNQNGFGAVEGLLIFVIIGIIVGAGWYVVKANKNVDKTNADTANSGISTPAKKKAAVSKPATSAEPDASADWLQYQSPNGKYSIKLPDGWKLVSYHGEGTSPYAKKSEDIVLSPGKRATVESTDFAGDNIQVAFGMGESWRANIKGEKKLSFKTGQGLDVDRYDYLVPKQEIQEISVGTTEYLYVVKGGKSNFQVLNDVAAGNKDSNDLIVQSIKTLVIKS